MVIAPFVHEGLRSWNVGKAPAVLCGPNRRVGRRSSGLGFASPFSTICKRRWATRSPPRPIPSASAAGECGLHTGGYFAGCSCLCHRSLPLSSFKERSDSRRRGKARSRIGPHRRSRTWQLTRFVWAGSQAL